MNFSTLGYHHTSFTVNFLLVYFTKLFEKSISLLINKINSANPINPINPIKIKVPFLLLEAKTNITQFFRASKTISQSQ